MEEIVIHPRDLTFAKRIILRFSFPLLFFSREKYVVKGQICFNINYEGKGFVNVVFQVPISVFNNIILTFLSMHNAMHKKS